MIPNRDASDLIFIIRNYLDAGNLEHLFEEASDIVDSSDYDYKAGSARILARDIMKSELWVPTSPEMTSLI